MCFTAPYESFREASSFIPTNLNAKIYKQMLTLLSFNNFSANHEPLVTSNAQYANMHCCYVLHPISNGKVEVLKHVLILGFVSSIPLKAEVHVQYKL